MDCMSPTFVREELLEAWPEKCAYVVEEILQTEEAYLNALEGLVKVCVCVCVCESKCEYARVCLYVCVLACVSMLI